MLNTNSNCYKYSNFDNEMSTKNFDMGRNKRAYVLSKHNFLLETMGTECKMIVRKYRFSRDLLFNKIIQNDIETVKLTRHDCSKMKTEKICGDLLTQSFPMQCVNNNTCFFKQNIVEDFPLYFGTIEKRFYECHLNEKLVLAQNRHQNLFHNSNGACLAESGVCNMPQSTIIWNINDIRKCPYERLLYLNDLERVESSLDNFLVISKRENYLFKLRENFTECDIDFYKTSEGLYLAFYDGHIPLKKKLEELPISKYSINHFTDRDKNNLIIAEHDFENNILFTMIEKLKCTMMKNFIRQNLHLRDTFLKLYNFGIFF